MYVYPNILFVLSVFLLLFIMKPVCSSTCWLFIWTQSYTQIKKLHCFISTCFSSLFSPTFDDFLRLIFSLTFLHLKLKVIFISNKKYFLFIRKIFWKTAGPLKLSRFKHFLAWNEQYIKLTLKAYYTITQECPMNIFIKY